MAGSETVSAALPVGEADHARLGCPARPGCEGEGCARGGVGRRTRIPSDMGSDDHNRNKCNFPAFFGHYDRPIDQPINQQTHMRQRGEAYSTSIGPGNYMIMKE